MLNIAIYDQGWVNTWKQSDTLLRYLQNMRFIRTSLKNIPGHFQIMYLGILWSYPSELYDHIVRLCNLEYSDNVPGNCLIMYFGIVISCTWELSEHIPRNCMIINHGIVKLCTWEYYDHVPGNCLIMYLGIFRLCTWKYYDHVPGNF